MGHGSKQNMKYNINGKYRWGKMNSDIDSYVDKCYICQMESPMSKYKDITPLTVNQIGDVWEIDMVGPFRESEDGFRFLITMIDHFSKTAEVVPVYTKDVNTVIQLIEIRIVKNTKS